jgi:hypothetical protein
VEVVGPPLVGGKVGSLPGSLGLFDEAKFLPKISGAGEGVGSQKGGGGQDGQGLVGDRQTGPCCLALCILQQEDVLWDVRHALVVLAHLNGEQYHIQRMSATGMLAKMIKEGKGCTVTVKSLGIAKVANSRVLHNSLNKDLDAMLSSLIGLVVLDLVFQVVLAQTWLMREASMLIAGS